MPWAPRSHRRTEANKRHAKTTTERGYGWEHQKHRKRMLAEKCLCEDCLLTGIITPATELHHVAKIKDRPDLARADENARMLCKPCHTKRTIRGE